MGGQYGEVFSSRVAVLARPKGGTIQNQRAEYFPTKGNAIIDLLYDSANKVSIMELIS